MRVWQRWSPHPLLLGMQTRVAPKESSLAASLMTDCPELLAASASPLLGGYPREMKHGSTQKLV